VKNDQDIPLQKNFGLRVKELRDSKGMTQEDLADAADLFRTYISRIETGLANPTLTVIHALANAMNEPVESLLSAPTQSAIPAKTFTQNPISRGRVNR
jgi:transcriptional regulator with XRE-family HTH domain